MVGRRQQQQQEAWIGSESGNATNVRAELTVSRPQRSIGSETGRDQVGDGDWAVGVGEGGISVVSGPLAAVEVQWAFNVWA
ncbi:hypothetical protein CRG98_002590 [Punica granatum]|uniref:Uncharacterized protein n=1 Tax=Punica granatum TaxID=22663 RepID=A0A2I0L8R7_PUNGR|nr:hypothetical protein CRG98_002590 [Punica granatum]